MNKIFIALQYGLKCAFLLLSNETNKCLPALVKDTIQEYYSN